MIFKLKYLRYSRVKNEPQRNFFMSIFTKEYWDMDMWIEMLFSTKVDTKSWIIPKNSVLYSGSKIVKNQYEQDQKSSVMT